MRSLLVFVSISFLCNCFSEDIPNPLFVGPLLLNSSENYQKGSYFINPYVYAINTYGKTSDHWKHTSIDNIFSLRTDLVLATGLTTWWDFEAIISSIYSNQKNQNTFEFNDTYIQSGFQIILEEKNTNIPSVRLLLTEIFPTGKYKNLDPQKNQLDGIGDGTFETFLGIVIGKKYYWIEKHPMKITFNFLYSFPSNVNVSGYNAYGGGVDAKGLVHPGNTLITGLVYECMLSKTFNFLMDILYIYQRKSTFSGNPGFDENGRISTNNQPKNQQLSLAPNLEINFNDALYATIGTWFSVISQNQDEFVSGVISFGYTF